MKYDNTYTIQSMIQTLQSLSYKHGPDAKMVFCLEQHLYDIRDIETTGGIDPVEDEHTCNQECICTEADSVGIDQHFNSLNENCPVCYCEGCAGPAEEPEVVLYLMAGDQHAYDKPAEFDSDLEKV